MDDNNALFGQWLKRHRSNRDLTQAELADRVGVAVVSLRKIESGERRPSKEIAGRLADALDVPPSERQAFVEFARAGPPANALNAAAAPTALAVSSEGAQDRAVDARTKGNLPVQLSSFVGREEQIAEVLRLLHGTRLVTLTGAGGCGKTRLALEVAARLADVFPDGVWLVDLAPLLDESLLPQAIASALGFRNGSQHPLPDQLVDHLAGCHLLLLLDNCEHLIDGCATIAEVLLRGVEGLTILATSRELLRIAGEVNYFVPSLQAPDPQHLPPFPIATEYEAMRLFQERARSVQATFCFTPSNVAACVEIVHRLDGMPLAIELAAARIRLLTSEQIAAHLGDMFSLLTRGSRTSLPRQQTLRASLDWSYALLTGPEAALLNRLAVFAGSFSLEAVEAVCAGESHAGEHALVYLIPRCQALDLLTGLVDHSLVMVWEAQTENRFRLLETVRQYGLEKLESLGELAALQERHLAYYLALAQQGEPHVFAGRRAWIDRFESEWDNFRAAMGFALEKDPRLAVGLGKSLNEFTHFSARLYDALAWSESILSLVQDWPGGALLATALYFAGEQALVTADFRRAEELFQASLVMARETHDPSQVALTMLSLGEVQRLQGNWKALEEIADQIITACQESGNLLYQTFSLWIRGEASLGNGDYEVARRRLDQALATARLEDMPFFSSHVFQTLGRLAQEEGDLDQARACYGECARIWKQMKYSRGLPAVLGNLGQVALEDGDWRRACALFREQFAMVQELRTSRRWLAASLAGFAGVAGLAGQDELAARLYGALAQIPRGPAPFFATAFARRIYDPLQAAVRNRLGDAAFEAAWSIGSEMSVEEALEHALQTL